MRPSSITWNSTTITPQLIAKGLRAAKEGKFVPHGEVKKMTQRMGRKK
jgi:predicted transcriptional regulator